MASKLSMSLDEVIKHDKSGGRGGGGRGRGGNNRNLNRRRGGGGGAQRGGQRRDRRDQNRKGNGGQKNDNRRRFQRGRNNQSQARNRSQSQKPQTGKGSGSRGGGDASRFIKKSSYQQQRQQRKQSNNSRKNSGSMLDSKTSNGQDKSTQKRILKISGLHFNIINSEIYDLFSQYGPLKKCGIDYDNLGRSKGTAVVKYENVEDAKRAIIECNGADLDGHKLRVEYQKPRSSGSVPGVRRRGEFKSKQDRRNGRSGQKNFQQSKRYKRN